MALFVKRNNDGKIIKVRKYIIDDNNEENVWCDDWYGRHIIGKNCEFIYQNDNI